MRWRPLSNLTLTLTLTLLLGTRRTEGLADFSNDLSSRILSSQHAAAGGGQTLRLRCPRRSTVCALTASWGRGADADAEDNNNNNNNNSSCAAFTALQKLQVVCEHQRRCGLPVGSLLRGAGPCPGTRTHLHVLYKCCPTEHKRRVVCAGERLTLRCKHPRVLNIYAAVYGRGPDHTRDTCPGPRTPGPTTPPPLATPPPQPTQTGAPPHGCPRGDRVVLAVSRACYGRQRCSVTVGDRTIGDACSPATRKDLTVLYACVPEMLLGAADPDLTSSSSAPDPASGPPAYPGAMMSDSLQTYAYIREHPETAALLFTCSVGLGLLLTLLAVSMRVTCRPGPIRCHAGARSHAHHHRREEEEEEEQEADADEDDDEEEEEETDSSLLSTKDRKWMTDWEEVTYVSEAAERVERVERRELVMHEIWMNAYMSGAAGEEEDAAGEEGGAVGEEGGAAGEEGGAVGEEGGAHV